jgi:protein-S-isoprenylcysteine O-methyltransferase Ste14
MTKDLMVRAGSVYLPLVAAGIAGVFRRTQTRVLAASLLSVLWTMPALVIVQKLNAVAGWWTYAPGGIRFCGMPLELYTGWVILWGVVPQLVWRRFPVAGCAACMVALDLIAMPLCRPVVDPGERWLVGEGVASLLSLLPALCIARWTAENSHLQARVWLQIALAGLILLFFVPELAFTLRTGHKWAPMLEMQSWSRQLGLETVLLLALPGVGAVVEFAERGNGTPIPFDAPVRLVTSSIYRYCANPMQVSCTLVLLAWAGLLHNAWLLAAPVASIVYGAGIAEWDEGEDLSRRFGRRWREYRASVRSWIPRWRPYHAGPPARLFLSASCGPCSELWSWTQSRTPVGMEIVAAETLAPGSICRMRYDPGDGTGTVEGVRALGRALEHLNLAWAVAGIALRLPLVWQFVQLVMDASGLGPRDLSAAYCESSTSPSGTK